MHSLLLWMFTVTSEMDLLERLNKIAARLILVTAPVLLTFLFWKAGIGWGVCAGLLLVAGTAFVCTAWYRWHVLEAPVRVRLARSRMLRQLRR